MQVGEGKGAVSKREYLSLTRNRMRSQKISSSKHSEKNSRATTKGLNRFGTFSHFSTLFHTFSEFFPQDFS